MSKTLTCIYKGHTFNDVVEKIRKYCELTSTNPDVTVLQRFCGALSYSSLFVISYNSLTIGHYYSAEDSAKYVPGIIKLAYNNIVPNFYKITASSSNIRNSLWEILTETMFGEVMLTLRLPASEVYIALLRCYLNIIGKEFTCKETLDWTALQQYLITEVGGFLE